MAVGAAGIVGHIGIPGLAPFIAVALFFGGTGAALGAYALLRDRGAGVRRAMGIGLGVVAFGSFGLATALPLVIHATPTVTRPSTAARLNILSPSPGAVVLGNPAVIAVKLRLEGGKIVPITSLHLVPNEGHIHPYLDGTSVSMTGLDMQITAPPGRLTLRAEFVAVDHRPFRRRVVATVTFEVRP